jgi:hypothetical protein
MFNLSECEFSGYGKVDCPDDRITAADDTDCYAVALQKGI